MGVNFRLNQYDSTAEVDECVEWWDSFRLAGDSDLWHDESIEWVYFDRDGDLSVIYQRPADFAVFEDWVQRNLHGGNKRRWLRAVAEMRDDESVWVEACS